MIINDDDDYLFYFWLSKTCKTLNTKGDAFFISTIAVACNNVRSLVTSCSLVVEQAYRYSACFHVFIEV